MHHFKIILKTYQFIFLFDFVCYDADEKKPAFCFSDTDQHIIHRLTEEAWQGNENVSSMELLLLRNLIQGLILRWMGGMDIKEMVSVHNEYASFRRLLLDKFRELKKVKDYSEALNMTEKSLNEVVKYHTGKNTSQIIYNQIILEAKRLLLMGMSAKETAYDLNFDDPGHFSKFFKTNMGVSPSEYGKIHD